MDADKVHMNTTELRVLMQIRYAPLGDGDKVREIDPQHRNDRCHLQAQGLVANSGTGFGEYFSSI